MKVEPTSQPIEQCDADAIVVPGGFGDRGVEGKIDTVRYARENRKEIPRFNRLLLQAEKERTTAKRANGLIASLDGSYGLTSSNKKLSHLLKQHETMKTIKLSFNILEAAQHHFPGIHSCNRLLCRLRFFVTGCCSLKDHC